MKCKECNLEVIEDKKNNPNYFYCKNCEEDLDENGQNKPLRKKEFEQHAKKGRVNDLKRKELERLVSIYMQTAMEEFEQKVKEEFFEYMRNRTKSKKVTEEVIQELFEASTFMTLMKDDANFVMEDDEEYWIDNIKEEMEDVIDFEKLNQEDNIK